MADLCLVKRSILHYILVRYNRPDFLYGIYALHTNIYCGSAVGGSKSGIYHARGKLYLNPKEPPFLMFKTKRGFFIINLHQEVLDFKQNMSL